MKTLVLVLFILVLAIPVYGQTIPNYTNFVNDFAGVLKPEELKALNQKVLAFKDKAEIAVAIVKDLQGQTIADFSQKAFVQWGVGKKGKDNGVLIVIAVKERRIRIHTGYGLEAVLPDSVCKRIISENMAPNLPKGKEKWGLALNNGVDAIIKRIQEKGGK